MTAQSRRPSLTLPLCVAGMALGCYLMAGAAPFAQGLIRWTGHAGLLAAAIFFHSRWVVVFTAPAVLFPLVFVADLQYWLWRYGNNLDPTAPLSSTVKEFTPPIFGPATIANFNTLALPGPGLVLAVIAAVLTGVGLWYHRKAYKPLIEELEDPS